MKAIIKINEKSIAESCKKAVKYYNLVINGNKKLQLFMASCFLLFNLALNAQDFEKINCLEKSSTEVKIATAQYLMVTVGNLKTGEMFSSYYSQEYGTIVYIFDKMNICKRMMIYSYPTRILLINRNAYDLKVETDNHKIVYSIKNK